MLKKVRVIEYFEGDILVELHSISGEVFLEKWADFDHGILVKTSSEELKKYLQEMDSFHDLDLRPEDFVD